MSDPRPLSTSNVPRALSALVLAACTGALPSCGSATPNDSEEGALRLPPPVTDPVVTDDGSAAAATGNVTGASTPDEPSPAFVVEAEESGTVTGMTEGIVDESEVVDAVETMVTENCASTEIMAVDQTAIQPADIIFVIDTSGSMGEETEFVQQNMNAFSQQIVDSGVDVRVIVIATPGQPGEMTMTMMGQQAIGLCVAAPLGSGTCPEDENLPAYVHVPQSVGSWDALDIIVNTYGQWSPSLRPDSSKSFVVVTDDNARAAGAPFMQDAMAQTPEEDQAVIDTFVAGLQALDAEMWAEYTFNGIFCGRDCEAAAAVGTVYQQLVAQTGGLSGELCDQDFQPVFDRLAEQIITNAGQEIACEWEIPAPPAGQSLSIDLVNVERSSDLEAAVALARVASAAECGASGWHFDDPVNPTRIFACPEACDAMQNQQGGRINISFGCQVIEGCAESGAAQLAAGAAADGCTLPLPPPPEGVMLDYSTINVRYDTQLGFFGILGTVAGEADCTTFGQGWYYDNPDKPTSIVLCPDSCQAYQAGSVNNIQAVFGCDAIEAREIR